METVAVPVSCNMMLPGDARLETYGVFASEMNRKARFVQNFSRAWNRIPQDAIAVIVGRWQSAPAGKAAVVFTDDKLTGGPTGDACGQCSNGGCKLAFFAPTVGRLPQADAQMVIAHELAHAFLLVTDRRHGLDDETDEEQADKLVTTWGFVDVDPERKRSRFFVAQCGVDMSST